jgi:hypothetical protein
MPIEVATISSSVLTCESSSFFQRTEIRILCGRRIMPTQQAPIFIPSLRGRIYSEGPEIQPDESSSFTLPYEDAVIRRYTISHGMTARPDTSRSTAHSRRTLPSTAATATGKPYLNFTVSRNFPFHNFPDVQSVSRMFLANSVYLH